ncbi:hypothetical protein HanHA300_Chr12g0433131 [Helianthus annuus]|nr:hypothetical protein HanHA300_Chr12g0433131 [Helianthus annuus]KAJ0674006.1 hypothetical protein HanLR1_Chr12g0435211 [Helianthus annuus]
MTKSHGAKWKLTLLFKYFLQRFTYFFFFFYQVLPLPNVPFFWILFRTYSHWRALKVS